MNKSDINSAPGYFDRYINLIPDIELSEAFDHSIVALDRLDEKTLKRLDNRKYQPDKWTANEILQHVVDWERILSYRALLFARRESSAASGIDHERLAANTNANERKISEIWHELKVLRQATKLMFDGFDDETLQRTGVNWQTEMSVLAIGFTIIGHQTHHFNTLRDKYLPLLDASNAWRI